MEIILLRHGKPRVQMPALIKASHVPHWIDEYNRSGVSKRHLPSSQLIQLAQRCDTVVCSDLLRSRESAELLGVGDRFTEDTLFREADLPTPSRYFPHLPPSLWAIVLRLAWLAGFGSQVESRQQFQQRVIQVTRRLTQLAQATGAVLLVGHGILNGFIAGELLRDGWLGPRRPDSKYWGYVTYRA